MSKVRVVTDSGSDLSPQRAKDFQIEVVPLSIRFGNQEFTDRVDLTPEAFYEKMAASDDLPETAAPAPGAFATVFESLAADGASDIICVTMSSDVSATGQSARTAAETVEQATVHCVDSRSVSVGLGNLAVAAAKAAAAGDDIDSILAMLHQTAERTRVLAVLDTLDNLKKGGRIGNAQALLGSMLSIKPCIDISSGQVEEAGRQRTRKKALGWLRDSVVEAGPLTGVSIGQGFCDDVDAFVADLQQATGLRDDQIDVNVIGPIIGAHGGPRVMGVSFVQE